MNLKCKEMETFLHLKLKIMENLKFSFFFVIKPPQFTVIHGLWLFASRANLNISGFISLSQSTHKTSTIVEKVKWFFAQSRTGTRKLIFRWIFHYTHISLFSPGDDDMTSYWSEKICFLFNFIWWHRNIHICDTTRHIHPGDALWIGMDLTVGE